MSWGLASGCTTWLIKLCKKTKTNQTSAAFHFHLAEGLCLGSQLCVFGIKVHTVESKYPNSTSYNYLYGASEGFFFFSFTRPPQSTGRLWHKDTVAANRTCGDSQAEAARWTTWEGRVCCVVVLFQLQNNKINITALVCAPHSVYICRKRGKERCRTTSRVHFWTQGVIFFLWNSPFVRRLIAFLLSSRCYPLAEGKSNYLPLLPLSIWGFGWYCDLKISFSSPYVRV